MTSFVSAETSMPVVLPVTLPPVGMDILAEPLPFCTIYNPSFAPVTVCTEILKSCPVSELTHTPSFTVPVKAPVAVIVTSPVPSWLT